MNLFDFNTAMHAVSNGGRVAREDFECGEYLGLDCNGEVSAFDYANGKCEFLTQYIPCIEDIQAVDWFIVTDEYWGGLDNRTNDEIQFDELVIELNEIIEEMRGLDIDGDRLELFEELRESVDYCNGDVNYEDGECECEECKKEEALLEFENLLSQVLLHSIANSVQFK